MGSSECEELTLATSVTPISLTPGKSKMTTVQPQRKKCQYELEHSEHFSHCFDILYKMKTKSLSEVKRKETVGIKREVRRHEMILK